MNEVILKNSELEYFKKGEADNPKYWQRLGGGPDLTGKIVLDIGCGHGSLCVDMAKMGASEVHGIDLDGERIAFAKENLKRNFPDISSKTHFHEVDLKEFSPGKTFDYITSKDALEHIIDLDSMINEIVKRLKVGGRLIVGFGPLYNSYYGDHQRTKLLIPWAHVFLPECLVVWYLNVFFKMNITGIKDLGLNMYSLKDYEKLFQRCGLKVIRMGINVNDHIVSKMFTLLAKIPFLREYFSHNIYAILEKTSDT